MGRPNKSTITYFPHDCKYGDTIEIIQQMYGNDGYAGWYKILESLGNSEGLFLDTVAQGQWIKLVARMAVSPEKACQIIDTLADLGAIDRELWQTRKIIWSQNFVDRLADAYRRRTGGRPVKPLLPSVKGLLTAESTLEQKDVPASISHSELLTAETRLLTEEKSQNTLFEGQEQKTPLSIISTTYGVIDDNNPVSGAESTQREKEIETKDILSGEKETTPDPIESDDPKDRIPYDQIISFLNNKAGTDFKASTKQTKACIKARFKEGFCFDDFCAVIENRCDKWLTDEKMVEYLRPQTIFGTKFEAYLVASKSNGNKPKSSTNGDMKFAGE
ncbi:MAG: conserved phage C-terminal domain-containing protein [Syntrophorhabdales bacterium]|jgi:uncharacterized phage protein (TIGR02220 family)